MKFRDKTPLDDAKEMLEAQAEILGRARDAYLAKEAERKHFESRLICAADGRSQAERVVLAQATEEWLTFHKELAKLEAAFEFQKLKYEILDKEWLARYLMLKSDDGLIRRQG